MPENKVYQTSLNITGNISPELLASLKTLIGHNARVIKQSAELGKESKKGFELFKTSAEGAKKSVNLLKDAIGELLLPIAGVVGAFQSIKGVFGILDEAADKFEAMKEKVAQFQSTLAATDALSKHPEKLASELKKYTDQAKRAGTTDTGLFGGGMFRAIQQELLAKAQLRPEAMEQLVAAIPLAVAQKAGGIDKVTTEGVTEMSGQIAQMLKTHTARAGKVLFGWTPAQVKEFSKLGTQQEINMILEARGFKGREEYRKTQEQLLPKEMELQRLKIQSGKDEIELGGKYRDIQEDVEIISLRTRDMFMNILSGVIEPMMPYIESAMKAVDAGLEQANKWIKWLFDDKTPETFGEKLGGSIRNAMQSVQSYWKLVLNKMGSDLDSVFSKKSTSSLMSSYSPGYKAESGFSDISDTIKNSVTAFTGLAQSLASLAHSKDLKEFLETWNAIRPAFDRLLAFDFAALKAVLFALKTTFDALNAVLTLTKSLLDSIQGHPDNSPQLAANAAAAQESAILSLPVQNQAAARAKIAAHNKTIPTTTNAKGGITTGASIGLIGEAGPELIYPLTDPNVLSKSLEEAKKANDANKHQLDQLVVISNSLQMISASGGAGGGGGGFSGGGGMSGGGGSGGDIPQGSMGGRTLGSFGYIGDATPDSASLKGVGAYSSHMIPGYSAGLSAAAQRKWGVGHGQEFTVNGHTFRLDDTDNSGGQENYVDVYNPFHAPDPGHEADGGRMIAGHPESWWFAQRGLAKGGIVTGAMHALLGERGNEAVIPLGASSLAKHGLGGGSSYSPTIHFSVNVSGGNEDTIVSRIKSEFDSMLSDSYQEFQRRALG